MDQRLVVIFVLLVTLALPAIGQEPSASPSSTIADLPRHVDYSREIGAAIKAEATADTDADRIAAVRWMARIYLQLKRDPRILESETLRGYKARLWGRLNHVQKRWEREVARLERELGRNASQADVQLSAATVSITQTLDVVAAALGGPAAILACSCETDATHAAMGGAARLDYGRELVELIQRTISPDFWDVNGGPGTIVCYAPLRALVVRATAEVHDEVGGVLGDLR
jgi:hypothetical protein